MDYAIIAREFVRAARGKRSQQAFSRRLGYASNVVAKWEAGRRMPVASEALRACARAGVDVLRAFQDFRSEHAALIGKQSDADIAAWLRAQRAGRPIATIAARVGCTRYRISRFLSGDTRPRLPEFFALVEALSGRLSDLIAALVDIEQVPSLARSHRQVLASRRAVWTQPWSSAVLALLATGQYRADARATSQQLARVLPISPEVAQQCLAMLRRAGVLGVRAGHYAVRSALVVDTRNNPAGALVLRRHFAQVGCDRLDRAHDADVSNYNVFSVSRADYQKMRQLQLDFFQQMRSIAASSEPSEVAGLLTMQLLQWDPLS